MEPKMTMFLFGILMMVAGAGASILSSYIELDLLLTGIIMIFAGIILAFLSQIPPGED
ncbi:MAG: hypothetical protein KKB03_03325 [Nanoarchaeota archaeon]|nr:hypothetical protein [Nanoarchaeota archaeon]MBU1134904.1 hypothetical protein [Nanoarchaeota archaeon]MBU2520247.1 hypothetical protein [Nanoarchaeota archaeon]